MAPCSSPAGCSLACFAQQVPNLPLAQPSACGVRPQLSRYRPNGDGGRLIPMSHTDVADILKLSVEERLRLVELIWESLAANPSTLPLSDAHRAVLDERVAEHDRNPDDVVTREEVLAEARRG